VLADIDASRSIILEAYTSAPFIKTYDNNTTTWSTMGGKFTTTKTGNMLVTFSFSEFNLKKKCVLLRKFMLMTVLSHQAQMI
jgi:hypothetical protein